VLTSSAANATEAASVATTPARAASDGGRGLSAGDEPSSSRAGRSPGRGSHRAPKRRVPSRSSPSSTRRPPRGAAPGEHRQHRSQLDRAGGDRAGPMTKERSSRPLAVNAQALRGSGRRRRDR
jgi:hypothetical protein